MKKTTFFLILSAWLFYPLSAAVRLPNVISSNMVIQRNEPVVIWGWADKGERITVQFNGEQSGTKTGRDGKWKVELPSMKAGGPFTMTISGENRLVLDNILIGDVWICSGQSNMEWPLSSSNNAAEEIRNANYPQIRLLDVSHNLQLLPVEDIPPASWDVCSPETVPSFSAVGYFFGRKIHEEIDVPIGLISTNWGGTAAEAWTSADYLSRLEEFSAKIKEIQEEGNEDHLRKEKEFLKKLSGEFQIDPENPEIEDWSAGNVDLSLWKEMEVPGAWEKSGLPGIDGVVWFRKEFDIPSSVAENGAVLYLGKIDDGDITYINGKEIGRTPDRYDQPRVYKIPPELLKEGNNVISVRITDTGGGGGFTSSPDVIRIESANFSKSLAGSWKFKLTAENLHYTNNLRRPNETPSGLYNGMIHPLLNLRVKGAIWYQGEANASRAYQYRYLFPVMIESWRDKWDQPEMPFIFVQLANFRKEKEQPGESDWAELREAQQMALNKLDNTGMAVTIDIGEANDIHPRNKQDVGYRLALSALRIAYDKDIVSSGPVFDSVEFKDDKAVVHFSSVGEGLTAKDKYGYLKGFAVAGPDKKFHWAKAEIEGNKVIVSSEEVKNPVAVRYAWADNPEDANLYNEKGLPASPFRTDDWPGITVGKK